VPKLSDTTRETLDELSRFVARQEVVDALEKAGQDKQILKQAKADPKGYLRSEGLILPPGADAKILQQSAAVSAQKASGKITVSITVCRKVGKATVCATISITVVVAA